MLITTEMLWNEIQEQKKMIKSLIEKEQKFSIEEVSLGKARKLLHIGEDKLMQAVKSGRLKARTYRSNGKIRYRFRLADIRDFQENGTKEIITYDIRPELETAEEIAARIFGKTTNNSTRRRMK